MKEEGDGENLQRDVEMLIEKYSGHGGGPRPSEAAGNLKKMVSVLSREYKVQVFSQPG